MVDTADKNLSNVTTDVFVPGDFAVGSKLKDRYILIEQLGVREGASVGAFGLVFLAQDTSENHRKVVVKTLKEQWLGNPDIVKHFFQETEALNRIHHDGVITVKESGAEANGRPFFVIDFVEGTNLREVLQHETLTRARCAYLVKEISYALEAIHLADVIHRDLKPENIIITHRKNQPERIKIIDFGASLVRGSTIAPSTVFEEKKIIGTPAYTSPEQLRRDETFVGEIFTLAAIAYEMITGKMAFPARSFVSAAELHRQGIKELPSRLRPELSDKVDQVILQGLAFDPAERYQSPIDFSEALAAALSEQPTEILPAPAPNSGRIGWLLFTAVLLLLVLAPLIYFTRQHLTFPETPAENNQPAPAGGQTTASAPAVFSYQFKVQKTRDGLPSGREVMTPDVKTIADGDKFDLMIKRQQAGNFYLIEENEGRFKLIFPVGSADRNADPAVWYTKNQGKNLSFRLIWSKQPIRELESSDEAAIASFLTKNYAADTPAAESKDGRLEVLSAGDPVIYKLLIDH